MLKPKKPHLLPFSTSAATHSFHVLAWWATTHVGSVRTLTQAHMHTRTQRIGGDRAGVSVWCVSVFVCTRGRGEMFLAEAQSGIRRLSLPRTSLTLFCLFLAPVARVNHSAALLAIAEKLPRAAAQLLSAHYVNKTPCCLGVRGHRAVQLQASGGAQKEKSSSYRLENYFSNVWRKKSETAALFLSHRQKGNVQ